MDEKHHLQLALNNSEQPAELCVALNFMLPEDGSVPEWVELIPPGINVQGVDGRAWINDRPQGVIDFFKARQARGIDLVFDFNHSTELKAPKGEDAPATGWGVEMEIRDGGAIWAKPNWNERGRNAITKKEYRYLSPVLVFERATGRIVGISSVGLTNQPNLNLTALNQALNHVITKEETTMDLLKALCAALGIAETSTQEQALAALAKLRTDHATALNSAQTPSLDKYVPRTDYDAQVTRANNAEQALATKVTADRNAEIDTAINAAKTAGKITPESEAYHRAACAQEGGLEKFKAYVSTAPVIAADSGLDNKEVPNKEKALNAEELAVCKSLGITAEEFSAGKA